MPESSISYLVCSLVKSLWDDAPCNRLHARNFFQAFLVIPWGGIVRLEFIVGGYVVTVACRSVRHWVKGVTMGSFNFSVLLPAELLT